MQRALTLAAKGQGHVHPNPVVGCVVVKNQKIIGEGFHARYGGPHAEIEALRKAGSHAVGATVYLTLEPCTHWGKTPPCAPALVKSGIKELFIALQDPNPSVNGSGLKYLKKAGIKVHLGLMREEAEAQNRRFVTWMRKKRPYTILKMAESLDGKIASRTGNSRWISSPESRKMVHDLRAQSDAVLVGVNTALKDNPLLTSHGSGRDPIRVILDPKLRVHPNLKLFKTPSPVWIITSSKSSSAKAARLEKKGARILRTSLKFDLFDTRNILKLLSKNNVSQLLIEGGGETAWSFISQKQIDELLLFIAPTLVGGRDAKTAIEGIGAASIQQGFKLKSMKVGRIGPDLLVQGSLN